MTKRIFLTLALLTTIGAYSVDAVAAYTIEPVVGPAQGWKHDGIFGTFDRAAAQRGLQVYREVCASCHSLRHVSFRTLAAIGFSLDEIKAIAKDYLVMADPNEDGDVLERDAFPSDYFPSPYPNKEAAMAANGGAAPPDLSLMTKKRFGGASYVYSLLKSYRDATADDLAHVMGGEVPETSYFNPVMPGGIIAMAPPLSDGLVEYADGQPEATVEQMAHDISVFLSWTAEPTMEARKKLGFQVMSFLLILCGLMFMVYRRVSRRILGH